jgi:hypothetical protein
MSTVARYSSLRAASGEGKEDFEFCFQEGCRTVKLMGLFIGFEPVLFTEMKSHEQEEIKIVSQHLVQLDEEEEEGFLDYILDGTDSFEEVTEITGRIANRIAELGNEVEADMAEINSLSRPEGKASAVEYKTVINRTAQRMEDFAGLLNKETPPFRDAYSRAIDCYGKAASLLVSEFDSDNVDQLENALEVVVGLESSITTAREGLSNFRLSIANLPRMTKKLNKAKRLCLASLDNYDREIEAGLQLTQEVSSLMENLLLDDSDGEDDI